MKHRFTYCLLAGLLGPLAALAGSGADDAQPVGAGLIYSHPKSALMGAPAHPPEALYRTAAMLKLAAPTNQWYSNLLFSDHPQPLHAHPASYRPTASGFEVAYPHQSLEKAGGHGVDVVFAHKPILTLQPTAFQIHDIRMAGHGDFSVTVAMSADKAQAETGVQRLEATVLHGSPFSYYRLGDGDLAVGLDGPAQRCPVQTAPEVLCLDIGDRHVLLSGARNSQWQWQTGQSPRLHFAAGDGAVSAARYFSLALLPDSSPETVAEFSRHAYAFVTDTKVSWHYDPLTSLVETRFVATVESMQDQQTVPLLGLYPHQQASYAGAAGLLEHGFAYHSVRGTIRTIASDTLTLRSAFHGVLPYFPALQDPAHREELSSVLTGDAARADGVYARQQGQGTYWYGKALSATAQLMNVAAQQGDTRLRDRLLENLEQHLEKWLDGTHSTYFVQDRTIGTVIGYPEEYGSVSAMNDHHFHYGYWINSAAQVALRDPAWAGKERWGGMVDLLVADIATTAHNRSDFPFLRNFDAYEGHSWASGDANFFDGNNQESSSEAMNAWAGLILYGAATHNAELRDLGIWLYTMESQAIATYWFDSRGTLFPAGYGKPVAAQVFGARYAYNTWWTEEPRQIQGINLLPITPASLHLAGNPDQIERFFSGLARETAAYRERGGADGTPADVWQDILASYRALADPDAALAQYRRRGDTELGETRSHTIQWLLGLKEMGTPDFSVTSNTPLYGVFRGKTGQRTYVAFNPDDQPLQVQFSSGKSLTVAPHQLGSTVGD